MRSRRVSSAATTSAVASASHQPGRGVAGLAERGRREHQAPRGAPVADVDGPGHRPRRSQPTIGRRGYPHRRPPRPGGRVPSGAGGRSPEGNRPLGGVAAAGAPRRPRPMSGSARRRPPTGCAAGSSRSSLDAARGRRPVRRAGPAHRRRHPGLRREALRAAGLADAAQRRRRGQPRLRAGRAPAAGQAADRARRAGVRLRRRRLAGRRRRWPGCSSCCWSSGSARRLTRSTLLGGVAGRAADLRRAVPRAVADGHARRVLGAVRASPRSPRCSATATTSAPGWPWWCAEGRIGDSPYGPRLGRALVAAGHRGAARAGLRR